jgi:hypothetical protein
VSPALHRRFDGDRRRPLYGLDDAVARMKAARAAIDAFR